MSDDTSLWALSPLDGRYAPKASVLANYFSEAALIRYRYQIEVNYLIFLAKNQLIPSFTSSQIKQLTKLMANISEANICQVKQIEKTVLHDVKAVEYALRQKLNQAGLPGEEYVHIGLTSEDVNSLAYSLAIRDARQQILLPLLHQLLQVIMKKATETKTVGMLARTHGQPAVATTLGKELIVPAIRLGKELRTLVMLPIEGKLTGAVGNFNAHVVGFPEVNWIQLSDQFVTSLGLQPNHFTTQILFPDSYLKIFQSLELINGILLGFNQDIWRYISDGSLILKIEAGQVGSSTMPQKVNPIDFENSEGNLGLANALLGHFIEKLAISRLQRDLSDSTVKRNIGSALGYCVLAYQSCLTGLAKISPNTLGMAQELENHWEIVAEGVQTILRTKGEKKAYELLKTFTQGKAVTKQDFHEFIKSLSVDNDTKKRLYEITPQTYCGLAAELVDAGIVEIQNYKEAYDR